MFVLVLVIESISPLPIPHWLVRDLQTKEFKPSRLAGPTHDLCRSGLRGKREGMKKSLGITAVCALVLILVVVGIGYSWTITPHGQLDLEVAVLLKLIPDPPPPGTIPVTEERERVRQLYQSFSGDPLPLERVEDRSIPGPAGEIPVRIYWPIAGEKQPILLYLHGGGFRVGDLDTHDGICRGLADLAGLLVVSVDYRLAPEHPFPAAVEDCYAALVWVSEHAGEIGGDPDRLAVGGDSSGGNLSAVTALKARDLNGPALAFQLLIYPPTNLASMDTDSWNTLDDDYLLTREAVDFMRGEYVPDLSDRKLADVSPLLAENHSGLPPALVITAEFDPLKDEGEAYAQKLAAAGVPTRHIRYEGVLHGFFGIPVFRKGRTSLQETAETLREVLKVRP
jgi:acetyl esterase